MRFDAIASIYPPEILSELQPLAGYHHRIDLEELSRYPQGKSHNAIQQGELNMNQKQSETNSIGKVIGITTLAVAVFLLIYAMQYF